MSEVYRGYTLNEYGVTGVDWTAIEIALLKAITDKLPEYGKVLVTSEHVHSTLSLIDEDYPENNIDPALLIDTGGNLVLQGATYSGTGSQVTIGLNTSGHPGVAISGSVITNYSLVKAWGESATDMALRLKNSHDKGITISQSNPAEISFDSILKVHQAKDEIGTISGGGEITITDETEDNILYTVQIKDSAGVTLNLLAYRHVEGA